MIYQDEIDARNFFTPQEEEQIVAAIAEAENSTSGEVRVHLEDTCTSPVFDRARTVFEMLEMNQTEARNGILIYIAVKDHKFAIFADEGITKNVPAEYWQALLAGMKEDFRKNKYCQAVCAAIEDGGRILSQYYPLEAGDVDELPNALSFS